MSTPDSPYEWDDESPKFEDDEDNDVNISTKLLASTRKPNPKLELKQKQNWDKITEHLGEWFYKPDFEALKVLCACYISHFDLSVDPIWLFLVGPSRSGKSSIAVKGLSFLPYTELLSTLKSTSLCSGFGEGNGLLNKIMLEEKEKDRHAIWLLNDFTTILNQDNKNRDELIGELRQVADRSFSKPFGNQDKTFVFDGKVSIIAATTPVIENYWSINRAMGERFVELHWKTSTDEDRQGYVRYASKMIGHEEEIYKRYKFLLEQYIMNPELNLNYCSIDSDRFSYMADFVTIMRNTVHRDKMNKITHVNQRELPTGLAKTFSQVARANACLNGRYTVNDEDFRLIRRLALDNVPNTRKKFLKMIIEGGVNYRISKEKLMDLAWMKGITKHGVNYHIEELKVLKIIELESTGKGDLKASKQFINIEKGVRDLMLKIGLVKKSDGSSNRRIGGLVQEIL